MKGYLVLTTIFFISIYSINSLISQSDKGVVSQLFDEKLSLLKGSIVFQDTSEFILTKKQKMIITKLSGDTLFIHLYGHVNQDTVNINEMGLQKIEKSKHDMYVLTSLGNSIKLGYRDWDIRPLTIPIKIRPKLDDSPIQFIGDVSIGPYIGYQIGTRRYKTNTQNNISMTFAGFGTPTIIRLDPSNTTDMQTDNANTVMGISLGGGLLLDMNNYQFGLVGGWDWIGGDASQKWIYQGKPWLSFSLGFSLDKK